MKKLIFLFLLSFCVTEINSQNNKKGIITYKSKESINSKSLSANLKGDNKSKMDFLISKINDVKFILKFNYTESFFTAEKTTMAIEKDQIIFDLVKKVVHTGDFYSTIEPQEILLKPQDTDLKFLVKQNKPKWKLTTEHKIINGYLCYKATSINRIENSKKVFNHKVTAWYCPELPFQFGPTKYSGLPGLILDLDDGLRHYYASNINFNDNIKVDISTSNKIISEEDYQKITRQKFNNMKEMIGY